MEQQLAYLINDAKRWADKGHDYLPTLGCSSCGKGCMPLCGLGVNRKVTPMETKDVVLQTRKSMMETGKTPQSMTIQFVSGTHIVIMCEKALECIEKKDIPGSGMRWVFTQPIPTMAGLLCSECSVCTICGQGTDEPKIKCDGRFVRACLMCSEQCEGCMQMKVKHHMCCKGGKYFFAE